MYVELVELFFISSCLCSSLLFVSGVNRAMGVLTEQLTTHLQRWLSSADASVKETLTRALQSRVSEPCMHMHMHSTCTCTVHVHVHVQVCKDSAEV